jgi:fimbrial chaperone protein
MTLHDIARRSVLVAAVAAIACQAAPARAAVISVSPVILEFAPGQKALTTTISNPGDQTIQVQVRLVRWSSAGDGETYTPTRDIGFSPPMFELKPSERQVVRMVLRTPRLPDRELAYRLIVDQLPDPEARGVQMPVRMVMPVFVAPDAKGRGRLTWTATADGSGAVLTAHNTGPRRVKIVDLNFTPAGGATERAGVRGYVLAGEARTWRVQARPGAAAVQVNAKTEDGAVSLAVPLTRGG